MPNSNDLDAGMETSGVFSRLHAAARRYAIAGYPIFPCIPNGKQPAIKDWYTEATTDLAKIDQWWSVQDYNIGLAPAKIGLSVIDLDVKNPEDNGVTTWTTLDEHKPETLTIETPSKGIHFYYEGVIGTGARKLGPGIDTRGAGGLVLLPPSVIRDTPWDGEYRILHDRPVAPLPAWIAARFLDRDPLPAPENFEEDSLWALEYAAREVRQLIALGDVPKRGNRDNRCYQMAARLRGLGLSYDRALQFLKDWASHGELPDRGLDEILHSAYRPHPKQNPPGSELPARDEERYQDVLSSYVTNDPPEPAPVERGPMFLTWTQVEAFEEAPTEFVWDTLLVKNRANLVTGMPGTGKTILACNVAVAVDRGLPLLGMPTKPMKVALLVTEDKYTDVRRYIRSIAATRGVDPAELNIMTRSVLSSPEPGGHLLAKYVDGKVVPTAFCAEALAPWLAAQSGPVLLILDPLDELVLFNRNDDQEARAVMRGFIEDKLCRIGDTTVLVADHPSRSGARLGEDYGGSPQLVASTASFFALREPEERWTGSGDRMQEKMTLKMHRPKYAIARDITYYRTRLNYAVGLEPLWEFNPKVILWRVYKHICETIDSGTEVYDRNSGAKHGPDTIAALTDSPVQEVKHALRILVAEKHLKKETSGTIQVGPIPLVMPEAYS